MCERLLNLQEINVSGQNICIEVYGNSVGTITPDEVCSDYLSENSLNVVTKYSFPGLFRQAFEASMTESNLKSGFRSCVYPYNPNCLPEHPLTPSSAPDNVRTAVNYGSDCSRYGSIDKSIIFPA